MQRTIASGSGETLRKHSFGYVAGDLSRCLSVLFMALRVPSRHRALQFDYQRDLVGGTMWFVSGSLHRNWGNQQGRRNAMLHAGVQLPL